MRLLHVTTRRQWRAWLKKHHATDREIWLVYHKKHTNKPRIPYNDAVEEALCFGWIDSTARRLDDQRTAQRFTPRRPGSALSEMNRVRVRRLIKAGKMTPAGLAAIKHRLGERFTVPPDILSAIKQDRDAWRYFQRFPKPYQRIRIAFVEGARKRPEMFKRRLAYLIKMSALNKKFGMVQ